MSNKIMGYRLLSPEEVRLINEIKDAAVAIGQLVNRVQEAPFDSEELLPDQRWVSIARTHLQEGFMALTRAVAKPTTF